jgi:hypothetical protein
MDTSITIKPVQPPYPVTPQQRTEDAATSSSEEKPSRTQANQALELTPSEARMVEQLKERDREVKSHELAHKAIAGQYARGAPSFNYQTGPDGRRYAVGGEVSIDITKESDPQATLRKAEVIRRAAMAPADPSGQDRQVAMQAAIMAVEARQQIQELAQESIKMETGATREPDQTASDAEHKTPTASERRAIASIISVVNSSQERTQAPFDQFI